MSGAIELNLVSDRVDVGDEVRVAVTVSADVVTSDWRLVLRCHVRSSSPASVDVVTVPIPVPPTLCLMRVPDTGPLTRNGETFEVSWSVLAVDHSGSILAQKPVTVTPRGGVALWMQRHTPPPSAPHS